MIRALLHAIGLVEDVGSAYTLLRRDYEASWKRIHELLGDNAELRAEVHAHEDRQERVWAMAREMRTDAGDFGDMPKDWRQCCTYYAGRYADVLTPPEAEEEETCESK